jgi:2-polyprenyl-3-methyl-5-hydroxy-6-metoxy-1,4-benzoquinol methylase
MRWAEPNLTQAADLMRWVYNHRDAAQAQATTAAARIRKDFSLDSIGAMATNRLLHLSRRMHPEKWNGHKRINSAKPLVPAKPISPEWYDEGYFETGLKSNWDRGYTWGPFSGLFHDTARLLTSVFAEADSYLDVGCAKGFLICALRELHKECWGFDHSSWAIDHAEESAKPFLQRASVDDISFNSQFDVLLAFSIFESLTEPQLTAFLSRARTWARQGLFATITCLSIEKERDLHQKYDKDLSHITMHTSQWWHEMFLSAGWQQDYLHRIVERTCREHELVKKMGWKVFVYAPR